MIPDNSFEKEILIDLGNQIRKKRIEMNLSQNDFAIKCGVSSSTIVRIESGTDARISNLIRVLDGFGALENINLLIPKVPDRKEMYTVRGNIKERASKKKRSH